ncbi:hypothetical protein CEP88_16455 [Roseobacter denitrificans]|nr:hypothetical protein CEP88_16455 [Roseobacter denitrificans]
MRDRVTAHGVSLPLPLVHRVGKGREMSKFDPPRSELMFRLWVSVLGLLMLAGAVTYRGWPSGLAMFEVIVIAGGFFGGTLIWTLRKLRKHKDTDRP